MKGYVAAVAPFWCGWPPLERYELRTKAASYTTSAVLAAAEGAWTNKVPARERVWEGEERGAITGKTDPCRPAAQGCRIFLSLEPQDSA